MITVRQEDKDEELKFFSETEEEEPESLTPWKLVIVDDEQEVHNVTRMVLGDFFFQHRGVEFLSAYSGLEAKKVIGDNPDTALILLDVVMETDNSGLDVVRYIRDNLSNDLVRIILRTGQPGQAPEREVILDYDINDYKEKSELSSQKLITAVISSLRSYEAIATVEMLNTKLEERVIERTEALHAVNKQLEHSLQALREDEEAGKKIQIKLLPESDITIQGYTFKHHLLPSMYMSGDFLDYFPINDEYTVFYLADVSGHGVSSAFITVLLKSYMNNALEQYRRGDLTLTDPAALLSKLNLDLLKENLGKHIAICYCLLNNQNGQLTYVNAGLFPHPLVVHEGQAEYLSVKAPPVGLFSSNCYDNEVLVFPEGARLFLFSDGILDILPQKKIRGKLDFLRGCALQPNSNISTLEKSAGVHEDEDRPDDIAVLMIDDERNRTR